MVVMVMISTKKCLNLWVLLLVTLNQRMSEWGDQDEYAGSGKDARVGVGQFVEQPCQRGADDAADASEEDDQPKSGGQQVQTEQVNQDDGGEGHVGCWNSVWVGK